uniref:uncharacterized protein n=1 Tax=Myxine glutinosa TaxID=7769 RepID=UPI00358F75D2
SYLSVAGLLQPFNLQPCQISLPKSFLQPPAKKPHRLLFRLFPIQFSNLLLKSYFSLCLRRFELSLLPAMVSAVGSRPALFVALEFCDAMVSGDKLASAIKSLSDELVCVLEEVSGACRPRPHGDAAPARAVRASNDELQSLSVPGLPRSGHGEFTAFTVVMKQWGTKRENPHRANAMHPTGVNDVSEFENGSLLSLISLICIGCKGMGQQLFSGAFHLASAYNYQGRLFTVDVHLPNTSLGPNIPHSSLLPSSPGQRCHGGGTPSWMWGISPGKWGSWEMERLFLVPRVCSIELSKTIQQLYSFLCAVNLFHLSIPAPSVNKRIYFQHCHRFPRAVPLPLSMVSGLTRCIIPRLQGKFAVSPHSLGWTNGGGGCTIIESPRPHPGYPKHDCKIWSKSARPFSIP